MLFEILICLMNLTIFIIFVYRTIHFDCYFVYFNSMLSDKSLKISHRWLAVRNDAAFRASAREGLGGGEATTKPLPQQRNYLSFRPQGGILLLQNILYHFYRTKTKRSPQVFLLDPKKPANN